MSKRMIDLLMTEGSQELDRRTQTYHPWSIDTLREGGAVDTGTRLFDEAEVMVVDNVTRYLYEACAQEVWGGEDYPNCAPPFPVFWMETRAPAFHRSGDAVHPWHGQHAWGALFIATELPNDLRATLQDPATQVRLVEQMRQLWQSVLRVFAAHHHTLPTTPPASEAAGKAWFAGLPLACQRALQQYVQMQRAIEGLHVTEPIDATARWHYTIFTFVQMASHDPIIGPVQYGTTLVSASGTIVPVPSVTGVPQDTVWGVSHGEALSTDEGAQLAELGNTFLMPMWLGLSFMHCKNVTLRHEDPCHSRKPPKPGERCRRLHYHVLNIKPMQDVLRREGHSETQGLKKSLHICRGHFKDYRTRGLFGKYQGLFWWESHIRGHSAHGVTLKDYAVHTPATGLARTEVPV
jgi:hypothetical protein